MKESDFKKGLQDMQRLELTEQERSVMLARILATPVPSPYARYVRVLVYVKKPAMAMMTACLVLVLGTGSLAYASEAALPGEALYTVKTKLIEPLLDKVNAAPEKKVVWEAEKVSRRLEEAQQLSAKHRLDDTKAAALKKKIEQSAAAFATAADESAAGIATSTKAREAHAEKLKQNFREKLEEKKSERQGEEETLKELKDSAVQALGSGKGKNKVR